jgi:integrase
MQQRQKSDDLTLKIQHLTSGLQNSYYIRLFETASENKNNAIDICNYITVKRRENNIGDLRRGDIIYRLSLLSRKIKHKNFREMTREDILQYMDDLKKPENADPKHGWINNYNTVLTVIGGFFRFLYYPNMDPKERQKQKPPVIQNIQWVKKKKGDWSRYTANDIWTPEDISLFLKYCNSERNAAYAAMAYNTAWRPHEGLKLKFRDIEEGRGSTGIRFADVSLSGKTGTRSVPIMEALPYMKQWMDHHPLGNNQENVFFCGFDKSIGKKIQTSSLSEAFDDYKRKTYPKLLDNPAVPTEDKEHLRKLLAKPWNPYILRHSGLTRLATMVTESLLRQIAGWTIDSKMPLIYIHHFGRASSNELKKMWGIIPKDKHTSVLQPKYCNQCSEPNKPNAVHCAKCGFTMTYKAYYEMAEKASAVKDNIKTNEEISSAINKINKILDSDDWKEFQEWKSKK